MKIICIICFVISIKAAEGWQHFDSLPWSPGDQIGCLLNGFLGTMGFRHWMLGSDHGYHVIHMTGDKRKATGMVEEQHINEVPEMFQRKYCENIGKGRYGSGAVQRARRMVGQHHKYDLLKCNCADYVFYWADGGDLCPQPYADLCDGNLDCF